MSAGADTVRGKGRKLVYRDRAHYIISLEGDLRERYSNQAVVFRVPYRGVRGGRTVSLMVAVELVQAQQTPAFEVMVTTNSASDSLLSELLLLRWLAYRNARPPSNMSVCQPVGVWTYESGTSLMAYTTGGRNRKVHEWRQLSKKRDDLGLADRLTRQARSPVIQDIGPQTRLEERAGIAMAKRVSPISVEYFFRNTGVTPGERTAASSPSPAANAAGSGAASTVITSTEIDVVEAAKRLPPTLKKACEEMEFGDLRRFIDGCLRDGGPEKEESRPDPPDRLPVSEEEFLGLVGLLRRKAAHAEVPALAPHPGPAPPFPPFEPSEKLRALREEQRRLESALRTTLRDPEATKRTIKNLRRRLGISEAEATALEATEIAEHEKRRAVHLRPHRDAQQARKRSERRRNDAIGHNHKRRGRWKEFAARVEQDVRRAFKDDPVGRRGVGLRSATRLPWHLLPPGEMSVESLRSHYAGLARRDPDVRYEPERIEKVFSLGPEQCYVGADEFDSYVVFTFAGTDRVLLECPIYGNAVYVLGQDWKRLSRMSKGELLSGRARGVTKIVHKGDWFGRVKQALRIK